MLLGMAEYGLDWYWIGGTISSGFDFVVFACCEAAAAVLAAAAAALLVSCCWICFFFKGKVRLPPAECFRFFFEDSSVAPGVVAAAVGDEDVGDLPIPSANNAATASPSSVAFSGVGADAGDLPAAVVLGELAPFSFATLSFVGVVAFGLMAAGAPAYAEAAAL